MRKDLYGAYQDRVTFNGSDTGYGTTIGYVVHHYFERIKPVTLPLQITIDTNVINTKGELVSMNILERWHSEGKLNLVGTQRLIDETKTYPPAKSKVESMANVSEPATWSISAWGSGYWSEEDGGLNFLTIAQVLFPGKDSLNLAKNDKNDVMHLVGHANSDSKIFITEDKNFLKFGRCLQDDLGIIVMSPKQAVEHLATHFDWI
jgi:hypothetical protein